MSAESTDSNLRVKYLDWCSAQVADTFLRLTPEEVFALAERATRSEGAGPSEAESSTAAGDVSSAAVALWHELSPEGTPASLNAATTVSYQGVVAQIAELLALQLQLPSFEEWADAYRAAPERYERDLLGFRTDAGGG